MCLFSKKLMQMYQMFHQLFFRFASNFLACSFCTIIDMPSPSNVIFDVECAKSVTLHMSFQCKCAECATSFECHFYVQGTKLSLMPMLCRNQNFYHIQVIFEADVPNVLPFFHVKVQKRQSLILAHLPHISRPRANVPNVPSELPIRYDISLQLCTTCIATDI